MAEKRLQEIIEQRRKKRARMIEDGLVPYPAEARRSHTIAQVLENFDKLSADTEPVTVVGRVFSVRKHGGVAFIDLRDVTETVQLQLTKGKMPDGMFDRLELIDVGDFIQAAGIVGLTTRGTQTIMADEVHMLAKSLRPLPSDWFGLKDTEKRYREREVDMIINKNVYDLMLLRSKVTKTIRNELNRLGFWEIETPILQSVAGGAAAEPFITHHNSLDADLYLRIAPELYLKRLLVGGGEKVFEIGRCFRNEGIDREHNPEFTMCEFYWAYADYEDLMDFTEKFVNKIVESSLGSLDIKTQKHEISFAVPWKRKSYIETLNNEIGFDILSEKDPDKYVPVFKENKLPVPKVFTYQKVVDELYKELVRPKITQPTILYDYPEEMVPLAKKSLRDPRIVEMFQLIVGGAELVKAYTELNDPTEQRARFEQQQKDREKGDKEVAPIDESYLRAMEYGMPPVAGWGLGIERLMSILTGMPVRETIVFPTLREKND